MSSERRWWILAIVSLAVSCSPGAHGPGASAHDAATRPVDASGGHLLLVGGGSRPDDVMRLFVELGGGADGRILVLPMASADEDTGAFYEDELREHGAVHVETLQVADRRDAMRPSALDAMNRATAVWFSGGDQSRIASRLVDTPLLEALVALRARGGVIGGTSAGTACQSDPMLVGAGDEEVLERGNIGTTRGLGLFEGVVVDQHFVARRRQNRLLSVVLEHPTKIGLGIDEATAVWAKPDGTIEVLGEGPVFVFDAREARVAEGRVLGAANLRTAVLVPGQRYDLFRGVLVE
ncbi:MAG: cyanophycinase [Sandaracinus sp.]|nr:cyanophycinase [Sandaracinus sp.]